MHNLHTVHIQFHLFLRQPRIHFPPPALTIQPNRESKPKNASVRDEQTKQTTVDCQAVNRLASVPENRNFVFTVAAKVRCHARKHLQHIQGASIQQAVVLEG